MSRREVASGPAGPPAHDERPAGLGDAVTAAEYRRLVEQGVIDRIELIDGRIVMGRFEPVFSPEQAAAAEAVGVRVRTCVDVLVEHRELRAELAARIADQTTRAAATASTEHAAALTEHHLREIAAGRRDPRAIPRPPASLAENLAGPADLLARALWIYAQGSPAAVTVAGWTTAPDPRLGGLSPAQWADQGNDPRALLEIAWRDATLFAR